MTSFEQFLQQALASQDIVLREDDEHKKHNDPQTICMNAPFLMRVLELVHEDVDNDKQLHVIVEAIQDQMKDLDEDEVLTMDNYDAIEEALELEDEEESDEEEEKAAEQAEEDEEEAEEEQEAEAEIAAAAE